MSIAHLQLPLPLTLPGALTLPNVVAGTYSGLQTFSEGATVDVVGASTLHNCAAATFVGDATFSETATESHSGAMTVAGSANFTGATGDVSFSSKQLFPLALTAINLPDALMECGLSSYVFPAGFNLAVAGDVVTLSFGSMPGASTIVGDGENVMTASYDGTAGIIPTAYCPADLLWFPAFVQDVSPSPGNVGPFVVPGFMTVTPGGVLSWGVASPTAGLAGFTMGSAPNFLATSVSWVLTRSAPRPSLAGAVRPAGRVAPPARSAQRAESKTDKVGRAAEALSRLPPEALEDLSQSTYQAAIASAEAAQKRGQK